MIRRLLLMVVLVCASAFAVDLNTLPQNTWVKVQDERDLNKFLCSTWYMPATDEFIMWGRSSTTDRLPTKYDVETFDFRSGAWHDSLPIGKETTWANGTFPNWNYYGYSAPPNSLGPIVPNVNDYIVSGFTAYNQVSFVQYDGVQRPTRCPTFHQACYDGKRNRMLFFVGGKTFSYDSVTRIWQDLNPASSPLACDALVWGSLCYDAVNDEAVLFGGGMALNTWGGAKTWIYDCTNNTWRRPALNIEPPLRCNAPMVYDSKNRLIILFGGDDQTKGLNDTWVYDTASRTWSERTPAVAPPGVVRSAATFVSKSGVMLMCGTDESYKTTYTWTYDAASNVWTPVTGTIPQADWISCDYSAKDDVVLLATAGFTSWEAARTTYVYRLNPATAADTRAGVAPNTPNWKHTDQINSLAGAAPGDRTATENTIKNLTLNTWLDMTPTPGKAASKTWTDCTMDTDNGVVLYYGGGHSGYSGSDVSHYDVGLARWSLSYDPEFPPYLESTNRTVFGWAYHLHPWSEHTRRWYAYDPVSKMMVYARQGGNLTGRTLYLGPTATTPVLVTGADNWIYDPALKRFYEPTFDRPFGTDDATCLITTPRGVYALSAGILWFCTVVKANGTCTAQWTQIDNNGPRASSELNPTLYDSQRDRLIALIDGAGGPEMWYFNFASPGWTKGSYTGTFVPTREACYVPGQDMIFQVTYAIDGASTLHQVFHCATNVWTQANIAFPARGVGLAGWDTSLAYDPIHNAVVMLNRDDDYLCDSYVLRYVENNSPPVFLQNPADLKVFTSTNATFSVAVSGFPLPAYQWQARLPNALSFVDISGETAAIFTQTNCQLSDSGTQFRCVATNSVGSATSNAATLTVVTAPNAPVIVSQPANQSVFVGDTATFTVAASGPGPLTYQWQINNGDIPGATASSYTTAPGALSDSGEKFRCMVSNAGGSVASDNATLTVLPRNAQNQPPMITSGPAATPNPAKVGETVAFSVGANDPDNDALTFLWSFGDGATGATPSHVYVTAGAYMASVTVSDSKGASVVSAPVPVTILDSNSGNGGGSGNPVTFSVSAMQGSVNFQTTGKDKVTLKGTLPHFPLPFNSAGQTATLNVGGAQVVFVLNAKGISHSTKNAFTLVTKQSGSKNKGPSSGEGTASFTAKLQNGTWASTWKFDPAVTTASAPMTMTVSLTINGINYSVDVNAKYKSKAQHGAWFKE
jgi:hypothetical protein